MKKETKEQKSKKKESVYTFTALNQPSPEAVDALHVYMFNLMKQKKAAGLI